MPAGSGRRTFARWSDLPIRYKGVAVTLIPAAAILLTAALFYSVERKADDADRWVAHTVQVKTELAQVASLIVDADLSIDSYLISRNTADLDPLRAVSAALPGAVRNLIGLVRDNPEQIDRLRRMSKDTEGRPLRSLLDFAAASAPGTAVPQALLDRSRASVNALRRDLDEMGGAEDVLLAQRTRQTSAARRQALDVTAVSVVLGVFGGLLAALLFSSTIGRRVSDVTLNAQRLAADEPLQPMASSADEVGVLAGALIGTSDLLRARGAALQQKLEELGDANRELEAFSYSVSHDLRAPLRHIGGFCALLQKQLGESADAQSRRYLGLITDAAAQMGRLVDDLLSFSRMGRVELRQTCVDLDALVGDVAREAEQDAAGRRIAWIVHPLPTVVGDPAMLRVAFSNLLSNAVKYTRTQQAATIEIGVEPSNNGTRTLYVKDNGVGFDMAYAGKLFGVFQRLHRVEEFEGTGIGLANVRRIVQRHGGQTWAQGAIDHGATFYMTLPSAAGGHSGGHEPEKGHET
ncbi:MAG TPA: ATP-binding protein [Vicinamibacterales bacterium]